MTDVCSTHPEMAAGWQCDGCRKFLCGDCTAKATTLYFCCLCGASATQLAVVRTDRAFSTWLLRALTYPARRGLPLVATCAVLLGGIAFTMRELGADFAGWSAAIRGLIVGLFAILIVDSTARGGVGERGIAMRLLRALLGTAVVWVPLAGSAYFLGAPAHDWTRWLFVGLATVYLPIALAVAVTDVTLGTAMNPFAVFELGWRLGRRYLTTLAVVVVIGAIAIGVNNGTADKLARSVNVPLVGDVAALLPTLAVFAIVLCVIGQLVYVHGLELGFGAPDQYRDPLLPDETARGKRKDARVLTTERLTKGSDPTAGGADFEERADLKKINDFLKSENPIRALKIYEARATWSANAFEDRHLLALGKAAQRAKNFPLAVKLFEEGVAKETRGASQLMIALAQLLADNLDQGDAARELYRKVVKKFPGSDAAKIAQQRLGAAG